MSLCCCNNRSSCIGISIVAGIIIGIITAFLSFTAVITITPAFLWTLFGIAIVYLAITFILSAVDTGCGRRSCVCSILPVLLTGILGTILTSVILLGITFAVTSVLGAVINGLLLAFFSLLVTTVACFSQCLTGCSECDEE